MELLFFQKRLLGFFAGTFKNEFGDVHPLLFGHGAYELLLPSGGSQVKPFGPSGAMSGCC